jgi:hypothetical protein
MEPSARPGRDLAAPPERNEVVETAVEEATALRQTAPGDRRRRADVAGGDAGLLRGGAAQGPGSAGQAPDAASTPPPTSPNVHAAKSGEGHRQDPARAVSAVEQCIVAATREPFARAKY